MKKRQENKVSVSKGKLYKLSISPEITPTSEI